jgi:hypothetical protein
MCNGMGGRFLLICLLFVVVVVVVVVVALHRRTGLLLQAVSFFPPLVICSLHTLCFGSGAFCLSCLVSGLTCTYFICRHGMAWPGRGELFLAVSCFQLCGSPTTNLNLSERGGFLFCRLVDSLGFPCLDASLPYVKGLRRRAVGGDSTRFGEATA